MLIFHTNTTIPNEALTLVGASTKDGDDSKIGFFGTGFKYAIAVLMRENVPLGLVVNGRPIRFDTVVRNLGDRSFDVICIDGKESSLTTRMGVEWKKWHAIREIWQNTIDEGGSIHLPNQSAPSLDSGSSFWIDESHDDELKEIIMYWKHYFYEEDDRMQDVVIRKIGLSPLNMYKLGMRVVPEDVQVKSFFDYNMTAIALNEMRLVSEFGIPYRIATDFFEKFTVADWRLIFTHPMNNESIEWNAIDKYTYRTHNNLQEALSNCRIYPDNYKDVVYRDPLPIILPVSMYENLLALYGTRLNFATTNTKWQKVDCVTCMVRLREAIKLIHELFEIGAVQGEVVDFNDEYTLGLANIGTEQIQIAHKVVHDSLISPLNFYSTVLEEMVHCDQGCQDFDRDMQTWLFNKLIQTRLGEMS